MKMTMTLFFQNVTIFLNFSSTSSHRHPLQVENCDSNSRLVVDEDDNVKSGLRGLNKHSVNVSCLLGDTQFLFSSILFSP